MTRASTFVVVPSSSSIKKRQEPHLHIAPYYIRKWILGRWDGVALDRIRGADVEGWLDAPELQELSNGTKAKIRNIMSSILSHAKRQGWPQFNPISIVRQSAQREHVPEVLTPAEARMIAEAIELREPALQSWGWAMDLVSVNR